MRPSFLSALIAVAVLGVSCSQGLRTRGDASADAPSQADEWDANPKDGMVTDTGGVTGGTGGSVDMSASSGATASGGAVAAGGTSSTGGTASSGGVTGQGGTTATGGTSATGGATALGGSSTMGGATALGGASAIGGSRSSYDAGTFDCVDLSGNWHLSGSCYGPRSAFNGSFPAVMTQAGCNISFTQVDDNSATEWTTYGLIQNTGQGYLKGNFGFTDSRMCDLSVTAEGWDMRCSSATQSCELKAQK